MVKGQSNMASLLLLVCLCVIAKVKRMQGGAWERDTCTLLKGTLGLGERFILPRDPYSYALQSSTAKAKFPSSITRVCLLSSLNLCWRSTASHRAVGYRCRMVQYLPSVEWVPPNFIPLLFKHKKLLVKLNRIRIRDVSIQSE